jgi:Na+(H+)/acetate symporter ActP
MRAVTWTQVAQYAILIVAYLVPVTILSYQVTGIPVPQLTYGHGAAEGPGLLRKRSSMNPPRSKRAAFFANVPMATMSAS